MSNSSLNASNKETGINTVHIITFKAPLYHYTMQQARVFKVQNLWFYNME